MGEKRTTKHSAGGAFKLGVISLAFLIIGYEAALFVHRASVLRIEALRDKPDTIFVYRSEGPGGGGGSAAAGSAHAGRTAAERTDGSVAAGGATAGSGDFFDGGGEGRIYGGDGAERGRRVADADGLNGGRAAGGRRPDDSVVRHNAEHSTAVQAVRRHTRRVESFRFNPNTVSVEDLMRLGFSEKQALSIDKYRSGGGRFRRKGDFAKSFVVSDSVYRRLEPFIDIPLLDINKADSAAFDALPGIGGWFAAKMVAYRESLGGYSCKEQLMEIYNFDRGKYDGLSDLIVCSPPSQAFGLWTLPAEELRKHPHIRSWQTARAIVLYRDNTPRERWTISDLQGAGVLDSLTAARLSLCLISGAD